MADKKSSNGGDTSGTGFGATRAITKSGAPPMGFGTSGTGFGFWQQKAVKKAVKKAPAKKAVKKAASK